MKKADWTLKSIAEENHKLNSSYFETGEFKKLKPFIKLGENIDFVVSQEPNALSMLDIGCGAGWYGVFLKHHGIFNRATYSGCDISEHMCSLAKNNLPECNFFVHNISDSPVNEKVDVVLESAVLELADLDWKKVLSNMLQSSNKWVVLHRLFYTEDKTRTEQVTTYLNLPDIRIHVGLKDLEAEASAQGFKIVHQDLWANEKTYKQGTFILKNDN